MSLQKYFAQGWHLVRPWPYSQERVARQHRVLEPDIGDAASRDVAEGCRDPLPRYRVARQRHRLPCKADWIGENRRHELADILHDEELNRLIA